MPWIFILIFIKAKNTFYLKGKVYIKTKKIKIVQEKNQYMKVSLDVIKKYV